MLSQARIRGLAAAACVLQALVLAVMIAGTHGWIVAGVKPNTTDYASFYAAGVLADRGEPRLAYDQNAHWKVEQAVTSPGVLYQYFFNPPPFLLVMGPLATLPYLASFLLFQALTLPLWLVIGTRIAGGGTTATFCLLAVPSVWWVLGLGQNSFLTASLLGAGMLLLPTRKFVAGVLFGLLCYKPHLGLLIPVALLAAGEWTAILGAGVAVAFCVGLTLILFGTHTWLGFFDMARHSVAGAMDSCKVLCSGRVDPTGAMQELGFGVGTARAIWIASLLGAATCVAWAWRRGGIEVRNAVVAAAALIAAPFALFYDLILGCLSAAWLVRIARRDGWLAGEPAVLVWLVVSDLLAAAPIVGTLHVPFGAVSGPILVWMAFRRRRQTNACDVQLSSASDGVEK